MITPDSSIKEQIQFYESKILQYLEVIKVNEKGEPCRLWIENIASWNREIIALKKQANGSK